MVHRLQLKCKFYTQIALWLLIGCPYANICFCTHPKLCSRRFDRGISFNQGHFPPQFLNWCVAWNGGDNELYSLQRIDIIAAHALCDFLSMSFVVRKRWSHVALEQLMCSISEYLRSLREIMPHIPSPGNAPALLLIIFRKHNLKFKKKKNGKIASKTNTFLIHYFFTE